MKLIRSISLQIFHTLSMNLLSLVARFLLLWCLGNTFLPEEYGAYALIGTILSMGVYILGLNLYAYMARQVPGKTITEGMSILKTILIFEVIFGLLIVTVIMSCGLDRLLLASLNMGSFVPAFRLAGLLLLLNLIKMEILRYHNAVKRIEVANVMGFVSWGLWVFPVVGLWGLGKPVDLTGLLVPWILGTMAAIGYGVVRLNKEIFVVSSFDQSLLKPALLFSLPTMLVSIGHSVIFLSDRWLLAFFLGADAVGRYAYAFTLMNILYLLASATVINVLFPYIVESENLDNLGRRDEFLKAMLKYGMFCIGIGIAVLLIHGNQIVALMTRAEYQGASELLPWLAPVPVLLTIMSAPYNLLYVKNHTLRLSWFYGAGMVVNLILNFLFIPLFGPVGAALGTVIALAGITVLLWHAVMHEASINWRLCKVPEIILATVVVWVFGWGLKTWVLPQAGLAYLGLAVSMVIAYVLVNIAFSVLGRQEWRVLVDCVTSPSTLDNPYYVS